MEGENYVATLSEWTEFYSTIGLSLDSLIRGRIRKLEKEVENALEFFCIITNPGIQHLTVEDWYHTYYKEYFVVFSVLILQYRKIKNAILKYYEANKAAFTLDLKQGVYAEIFQSVIEVVDYHHMEDAKKILTVLLHAEEIENVEEYLVRIFEKCESDLIKLSNSYHELNFELLNQVQFKAPDDCEDFEEFGNDLKTEVVNASLPFRTLALDFEKMTRVLRNSLSVCSPDFVSAMIRLGIYFFLAEHRNCYLNSVFSYEADLEKEEEEERYALSYSVTEMISSLYSYVYHWYFNRSVEKAFDPELVEAVNTFYNRMYPKVGRSEWKELIKNRGRETHYYGYANFIGISFMDRWYDAKSEFQQGAFDANCYKQALLFTLHDYGIADQQLCIKSLLNCKENGNIDVGYSKIPVIAVFRNTNFNYRYFRIGNALVDTIRKQNLCISELQDEIYSLLEEKNVSRETFFEADVSEQQITVLQQSLDFVQEENRKLQLQLEEKGKQCNCISLEMQRLQNRYEKLLEERDICIQDLRKRIQGQAVRAVAVDAFGGATAEDSVEEIADELNEYHGVFIGGDPNLVKKIAEYLPDWLLVDGYSALPQAERIQNKNIIVIYSDALSHSKFNRVQSVAQQRNIPLVYVHGTNLRIIFSSMIGKVKEVFAYS